MRRISSEWRGVRAAIAIAALYAFTLGGFLADHAIARSAGLLAAGWCPIEDGRPVPHGAEEPCLHACRIHASGSGVALAPPPSVPSLLTRAPQPVVASPLAREVAPPRIASSPLGARAPPSA